VLRLVPCAYIAVANTPAGLMEFCSLVHSISFGLPSLSGGSASCVNGFEPAQRSSRYGRHAAKSLCDLLHQRLQQSRCLHWLLLIATGWSEPSSRAVVYPAVDQRFHGATR